MSDNRKRIIAGLATAAGAVGAYFGIRALMNRMPGREYETRPIERFESRLRAAQEMQSGSVGTTVQGTRYQPHTQPDRQPIPATGEPVMAETAPAFTAQPVTAEELAGPLAKYLITFHEMIHQLRLRRWENQPGAAENAQRRSLTAEDRTSYQAALERLADQLPELSDGDLPDGSLQQRMYDLAVKVRGALQNLDYQDDDLFRINGEVRSEACQVLNEVLVAGQDVRQARQLYECG